MTLYDVIVTDPSYPCDIEGNNVLSRLSDINPKQLSLKH